MPVSTETLIRLSVLLFYLPAVLFCYRRLMPRLSPTAWRLATAMLAAQALVIVAAQVTRSNSSYVQWLWDFHEEWNIPAIFATTQLALVGGVALLIAWRAAALPRIHRFYLLGVGLVFLFLGLDEYLALHEFMPNWELRYAALGAAVLAGTVAVAWRSPKPTRLWHICLLTGLAVSVAGAMALNALPTACGSWGPFQFDGCLQFYFQEESLEFLGIWLALVAMLGQLSWAIPQPSARLSRLLYALPPLWILLLFANSLIPRLEVQFLARPAAVQFESGIQLRGYRLEQRADAVLVRLYASARQKDYHGLGYSLHLVDQANGESVAALDVWADRQHSFWPFGPDYVSIYGQWMHVRIPSAAPVNRALWVVLTLWRRGEGEFERQQVIKSDLQRLEEKQVVLGEFALPNPPPIKTLPLARFDGGFALAKPELPERARPGESLQIRFTWRSEADGSQDFVQFLHLGHEESGAWRVYDQQPLGARLPTRLWYDGLAEGETWQVPLPADLAKGHYNVFTGLYRVSDRERLPVKDAEGEPFLDARVPLGSLTID